MDKRIRVVYGHTRFTWGPGSWDLDSTFQVVYIGNNDRRRRGVADWKGIVISCDKGIYVN